MKILIAGDYCQRYRVDERVRNQDYASIFNEITPLIKNCDFSVVNFEFPIVLAQYKAKPIKKCGPHLSGSIESVDAIKYAGFNCCTLANNHILDQGEECCTDTIDLLENAGIKTVGAGTDLESASQTLYLYSNGERLAIINCCEHEFSVATTKNAGANPLNPIKQYYKIVEAKKEADYVLVVVHGGPEFYQLPTPRMKELYEFFIEVGADCVVNHHQHCYSGYEIYKNKPIVYGLGNLCFDHKTERNSTWNEGFLLEVSFAKNVNPKFNLHPYTQCTEDVGVHLIDDKNNFRETINNLNTIIDDNEKLDEATISYYDRCAIHMYACHSYENVVLNKLWRLGLIPSQKSIKKMFSIWNLIECESHRDKTYYAFKKYLG